MAKIVSPVWSSARGSIAGTTYLTLPSGAIVARQRNIPVNPRSTYQSQVRSAMAAAASAWTNAAAAKRAAWKSYALQVGYPSGRAAFIAGYTLMALIDNRFAEAVALNEGPPGVIGKFDIGNVNVSPHAVGPGTGIDLDFTSLDTETGYALIEVSPACSPARNFWVGPWDQSLGQIEEIAAPGSFNVPILSLIEGAKYFVRVRGVSSETGFRASAVYIGSAIAATVAP